MAHLRNAPLGIAALLLMAPAGLGLFVPLPEPKGREPATPYVQWRVTEDFASNEPHDPIVVGDKVIVGTDQGGLRAYRCADGKLAWVNPHGKRIFYRPCSDGQRVYFSSAQGVTAVRAEDGTEIWNFNLPSCDGPILVLEKQRRIYVGGNDGFLYALDSKTGNQVWASDFLADAPPDGPKGDQARLANTKARPSALASDGENLFLSVFDQCRILAIHAANGKRLWSFQTGGWIFGSAVATDKHVFIGSQDKTYYCLDKQTGKKIWSYQTKGRIESGGVVDGRLVTFGSCDGSVYCLDQFEATVRWQFASDGRAIYSVPVVRGSRLHFAVGEGQAYAVDRISGELAWKIRPSPGSELYCSLATDGNRFFAVTRSQGKGLGEPSLVAIALK